MEAPFDFVPDHIVWEDVLGSLAAEGDHASVARFGATCRRMRALASTPLLWTAFDATAVAASGRGETLLNAPGACACERFGIDAKEPLPPWLAPLLLRMRGLRALSLRFSRPPLTGEGREEYDETPTSEERAVAEAICALPRLQRFVLGGPTEFRSGSGPSVTPDPALLFASLVLPASLERLRLPPSNNGVGRFFAEHGAQLGGLTRLDVTLVDADNDATLHAIATSCPRLRRVLVDESSGLPTAAGMGELWTRCTLLEDVGVHIDEVSRFGLAALAAAPCAPNIRRLFANTDLQRAHLQLVSQLPALEELKLCNILFRVHGGIDELASLSFLRRFSVYVSNEEYHSGDPHIESLSAGIAHDLQHFGASNPHCVPLQKFKLACNALPEPLDLSGIFSSLRLCALEELRLEVNVSARSAEVLVANGRTAATLRKLDLDGVNAPGFAAILLRRCAGLQEARLYLGSDEEYTQIFAAQPAIVAHLRFLRIISHGGLSDARIQSICDTFATTLHTFSSRGERPAALPSRIAFLAL